MDTRLLLAILLVISYHQSIGQEEHVCYHINDMNKMWLVQCYGIDSTNTIQVTLILKDATRRAPHVDIRIDVSNSVGSALPEGAFDGYKISEVVMKYCNLTSMPYHLITNLPNNVKKMDLSKNAISDIDFQKLNDLPYASHLQVLRLYSNQIDSLPKDAFINFTRLTTLELQDNRLLELVDNTFRGMARLSSLNLFKNQIKSVGRQAFATTDNLVLLSLELNEITFLEEGTFSVQNQINLRELPLEGNPFYCNCSMEWLKDYLASIHYLEVSGATCLYPRIAKFHNVNFCTAENETSLE